MQTRNRLLDDLAKVANSAVNVASGLKGEIDARLIQHLERVLDGMDLVGREEFEAVKAMAAEARAENERLSKRLAKLEGGKPKAKPSPSKTTRAKPTRGKAGKRAAKSG